MPVAVFSELLLEEAKPPRLKRSPQTA